jgi:hypothetical protein
VRVLNESFVMGYGRQGRGGSTSRQESNDSSREKKENKPAETDVSADEIRRMVAKFLKELSSNTNPRKKRSEIWLSDYSPPSCTLESDVVLQ